MSGRVARAHRQLAPEQAPDQLKRLPRWVLWSLEDLGKKKFDKVPYQADGKKAKSNDPRTWTTFGMALAAWKRRACSPHAGPCPPDCRHGLGFMFDDTGDDLESSIVGVDLDHVVEETGAIAAWAQTIIDSANSYTEFSPNDGIHIFVLGEVPGRVDGKHGHKRGDVELYGGVRFFTVTGCPVPGTPAGVNYAQAALEDVYARYLTPKAKPAAKPAARAMLASEAPTAEAVMAVMRRSRSWPKIEAMLKGDTSGYPSQSEADAALVGHLWFYTGGDAGLVDEIFRTSGLMRDKWERADYRERTTTSVSGGPTYDWARKAKPRARLTATPVDLLRVRTGDAPHPNSNGHHDGGGEEPPEPDHLPSFRPPADATALTDLGNAERLRAHSLGHILHCDEMGLWFVWDGKRFNADTTRGIYRRAAATARRLYVEAAEAQDLEERQARARHAVKSESAGRLEAMVNIARSLKGVAIPSAALDADDWLLNVRNGTLDLRTGQLRPHNPQDFITKLAGTAYDPAATCPTWLKFIDGIMLHRADMVTYLQKLVGYSLTGDTRGRFMMILFGTGNNGKSTLLEMLRELLSDYADATPATTLMERDKSTPTNDLARLKGARLVTTSETQEGQRLDEPTIKQLTGNDTIAARFHYKEFFEYVPCFKLWMATNHRPVIRGTDAGIWNRIRLIPFDNRWLREDEPDDGQHDREDPALKEKLRAELAGILRWAVEGCLAWQRAGLRMPDPVRDATAAYRTEQDVVRGWMDERCTVNPNVRDSIANLFTDFQRWCEEAGERARSRSWLSRRLKELGFQDGMYGPGNNRWRGFEGIARKVEL